MYAADQLARRHAEDDLRHAAYRAAKLMLTESWNDSPTDDAWATWSQVWNDTTDDVKRVVFMEFAVNLANLRMTVNLPEKDEYVDHIDVAPAQGQCEAANPNYGGRCQRTATCVIEGHNVCPYHVGWADNLPY